MIYSMINSYPPLQFLLKIVESFYYTSLDKSALLQHVLKSIVSDTTSAYFYHAMTSTPYHCILPVFNTKMNFPHLQDEWSLNATPQHKCITLSSHKCICISKNLFYRRREVNAGMYRHRGRRLTIFQINLKISHASPMIRK